MPIYARTSGGVYKEVSRILTADGSEIGKVVDSTGRIIYEASRLITVTGVPPISFTKSIGKPLVSWDLLGNAQQTGTPSPDNIIMPDFCGVRTGNLFDKTFTSGYHLASAGKPVEYTNDARCATLEPIDVSGASTVTFSFTNTLRNDTKKYMYSLFDGSTLVTRVSNQESGSTIDVSQGDKLYLCVYSSLTSVNAAETAINIMLNTGSTALPYEPYGWKISFTCAGQTVPVYLGQTPTVRRVKKLVLTGGETWTLQSINEYGIANLWTRLPATFGAKYLGLSSHFTIQTTMIASTKTEGLFFAAGTAMYIRINATRVSTVAELKSYLAAQYAAGTPVTVWYVLAEPETAIVNEPLAKIGDYADELHSTDAAITIPTAKGNNTLTVETDLPPSSMTIVYKGR